MRGFLPQPPSPRWATRVVWLSLAAAVLSIGLFVSSASATVMKYAGLERLIEISESIVHGEVIDQNTYFDKDQKRVVTDTTFAVKRTFWGSPGEKVTIQQWGGTFEGKTHSIPGDARFEAGEEVVVFLHSGDNVVALSALGQAKFSVEKINGKKLVTRDLSDIGLLTDNNGQKEIIHRPEETQSFESFTAELESLVAGIKGGKSE
jgi:hypothetical protein